MFVPYSSTLQILDAVELTSVDSQEITFHYFII